MAVVSEERAPAEIRAGVRSGILDAIQRDVELRGGRTARLLAAAGVLGVLGAVGVTLLVGQHPFGHHPSWHMAVFAAVWAGLLVVCLSIAFLRVRTPTLALSQAASVALMGLGVAGICGAACPDPHFLHWWSQTTVGASLEGAGGPALSALCFGLVTTILVGGVAAAALLGGRSPHRARAVVPAAMLAALLAPGVVLQSVDAAAGVPPAWLIGVATGSWMGVAAGIRVRFLVRRARTS